MVFVTALRLSRQLDNSAGRIPKPLTTGVGLRALGVRKFQLIPNDSRSGLYVKISLFQIHPLKL